MRDPRKHPKQGDVIRLHAAIGERRVMSFDGRFVEYESMGNRHLYRCSYRKWLNDTHESRIIDVAAD